MKALAVCGLVGLSWVVMSGTAAEANAGRAVGLAKAAARKHNPAEAFRRMDTNNDGKISIAEFRARHEGEKAEHLFRRIDKNNDGFITIGEFEAAMEQHRHAKKK